MKSFILLLTALAVLALGIVNSQSDETTTASPALTACLNSATEEFFKKVTAALTRTVSDVVGGDADQIVEEIFNEVWTELEQATSPAEIGRILILTTQKVLGRIATIKLIDPVTFGTVTAKIMVGVSNIAREVVLFEAEQAKCLADNQ